MEIELNSVSSNLTIPLGTKAQINTCIRIIGTQTKLPITIIGEFKDIPSHLHQMYIESMLMSYSNVDIHNNTKEEPKTIAEKKSDWRINRIADIFFVAYKNYKLWHNKQQLNG
jgi:hypothetical protein